MYLRCTILLVLILQAPAVLSQNVCNENTCYYNITSAIENASDGNTITVHGNHEEAVTVNKSITLTGNHSLLTAQSTYVLNITARNVTIANLSISNSGKGILVTNDSATLSNLNISTHGGDAHAIDVQRSNHTLIKNSAITTQNGSNNFGIYVRESSNATITNTTISTNGSNDNYAIFLQQNVRNVSITRNTLQTAGANGNDLALHLATQVGSITISENNISSLNGAFSIPIYLYDNVDDVVIQNNNITPAIGTQNSGIYMEQHLRDVLITGNRIYVRGNHSQGIVLDSAQEITITANNITLTENGSSITLMESVSETHSISIYNNYFYARTIINGSGNATLNTSLSVGENIIGGPSIGGNYYDNATSFSRTCTDSNEDGICDETLSIAGFIDYLPLATLPSNRCQTLRTNESTFTLNRSVQSAGTCFRLMGNSSTLECTQGSINHSLSLPEHGITIEGENVTIRNCTLYQKNSSNNAYNIYVTGNNARLENVTTNNSGNKNHGIAIAANYSSIVRSSVTAGSDFSHAILLNASSHSSVVNSSLHTKGGRESHVVASYNGAHNRIEGTRITSLAASFWNFGIYLFQGRNETIHNSSITTFSTGNFLQSKAYGVHVEKSNHTRVERVDVATSGTTTVNTGINIEESSNVSIEHARIRTNGTSDNYGVRAYRSTNVSIAHTTIATNGTLSSNIGIFLEEGVNNSILDNTSIATYGTGFNYGVLLYDNNNHNTLQNLTLLPGGSDGSNHGIYFETESRSNVVQSNTITTNTSESHGIYLFPSVNNTIRNNRVTAHQQDSYALLLADDATLTENNTIYNNLFNASQPVKVGSGINTFSIAVSSSTNILGGSNIGGNAYDNASGDTSFSRSCTDTDQNDICDSSLAHNANNADHAPLAIGTRSASTSAHSGTSHDPSPSGGIYICSPKWVCSEWTCTNGTARRTCSDENNCQTGKPAEEKTCPLPQKATQYALFDIQSELLTYNKSSAVMRVSLINFGDPGSVNVQLVYTLLHHNGDILLQEFETVEVETQHEFLKTLNLPQLAPGEYSILTELLYDGQKEPARTLLPFIITTKHSSFPLIVLTIPAIFTALSAAYVLHSRAPSTSYIVCRRAIEEVEHAAQIHDHKKAVTHFLHLRYYFHQLSEKEQKKLGEDALRTYHLVHNLFQ